MEEQVSHIWNQIEDLPSDWKTLGGSETSDLVRAWQEHLQKLKQNAAYERFMIQLRRQWAIETGVLERLYTLSEGATKTLIEKGFDEALISHEDTNRSPREVLAMITDQHLAIQGLYQFISGNRPLGTSYLKELHRVLTSNQKQYDAIDQLGNEVVRELPRGEWKKWPNNVTGPGGFIFQFCPPEHVDSEIEQMLTWHHDHEAKRVPADVEAAWLHHRFTLIHPFADGNGRVARCLATLVLLKANWFPLVVTRHDRVEYISSLRAADSGDLSNLVRLFDALQSRAIRQALSVSEENQVQGTAVQGILHAVRSKLHEQLESKKKQVLTTGDALHVIIKDRLHEVALEVEASLKEMDQAFYSYSKSAPRADAKSHYYDFQIIQCAKSLGYYANRQVFRAWAVLAIVAEVRTEILFSIHGIGRDTGILVCSAMAYTKQNSDESEAGQISEVTALKDEPFYFTHREDPTKVSHRFRKWAEESIVAGLNYWRKAIGA